MKKTIQLFSILLLVMLIQSCSKTDPCPKGQENYYNLTDEEKSKIPYTGTDTLVFISDKGDTATLIGQGKSQSYKRTTSGGNPDCGAGSYVYENYEKVEYNYSNMNSELSSVNYQANVYYLDKSGSISLKINNASFNDYILSNLNNDSKYKDSTLINDIYYKGIMLKSDDNTVNILFNYKYGVLYIKNLDSKNWRRKL